MTTSKSKIIYTFTDEAPALATASLLPIIKKYTQFANIEVETKDISLASRIIAQFSEELPPEQRQADELAQLGLLVKEPDANIIKLPNISASIPQLNGAIKELQSQGYNLPNYPEAPINEQEKAIQAKYAKVLGSAANPILREGNSDRRVATAVKKYAQNNPHSMGAWSPDSKTEIAAMSEGDFYGSEKSVVVSSPCSVTAKLVQKNGDETILKKDLNLLADEVLDSAVMSCKKLRVFYETQMNKAKDEDVLLSLHLKATMMKVSDPVIFGHAVTVYFKDVFKKHQALFNELGVDVRNGLGDVYKKISSLSQQQREEIEKDIQSAYDSRPKLAMVDSDKGITNLHVPSDVIIDASMPAALRSSGKMWGADGKLHDTLALIPDRCYAGLYQQTIQFHKKQGAFDVKTMGDVSNVGLMAQQAEEYGSHDKTFIIQEDGVVQITDSNNQILMEQTVERGDIFRMCQTKDIPIRDWVKLAVNRAKATHYPTIFWLDPNRAHDANLISKVNKYLKDHDTQGLDIQIMSPNDAIDFSLQQVKAGKNVISVTGNILRDYLTDLFPILELGTSAKMLSIVPLLAGGGLFETGAGGSAPKHVQQFLEEGHLRWDSLGEFLALAVSLEDLATKTNSQKIAVLAGTLNIANAKFLSENKSPSRKSGEIDNRGSHFYLAMYWAQALANQSQDLELQTKFRPVAASLEQKESIIMEELNGAQNQAVDIGGYYHPDQQKFNMAMRPSQTFNTIINSLS
ncbi:MAG: isocitrate dehydrogenase (NADP(+)) [Gammaproteobacteria bacterium CG22_combo_CG10-13_8_21_14_all_40_8]|nr:MAG: isocitrate dehydrogenase (NADP(+)) [Gammaproteobacteria bacterium CG22_combo_CG10-13_8_21_14_all_40_8]